MGVAAPWAAAADHPCPAVPARPAAWDETAIVASLRVHPRDAADPGIAVPIWVSTHANGRSGLAALAPQEPPRPIELPGTAAGPPLFDPSTGAVHLLSCDGWLTRSDRAGGFERTVRAGIAAAGAAIGASGVLAIAVAAPPGLVILDRDYRLLARLASPAPPIVRDARSRRSFVALVPAAAELWEVSYDPAAPDIAVGTVHDFQFREGALVRGYLNARRIRSAEPVSSFTIDPAAHEALLAGRRLQVIDLDVRKRIAVIERLGVRPELAVFWSDGGTRRIAVPADGTVLLLDALDFRILAEHATAAPPAGLVVDRRRLWLRPQSGDTLIALDRATLAPAGTLRPEPGRAIRDLAFDASAGELIVAVAGRDGYLAAFDADSGAPRWRRNAPEPAGIVLAPALTR